MTWLLLALLCLLSQEALAKDEPGFPACEVPKEAKDARGCVTVEYARKLTEGPPCALPDGFCFSIPYREAKEKMLVVDVTGKGSRDRKESALTMCKSVAALQDLKCRLGKVQESAGPVVIKIRVVED